MPEFTKARLYIYTGMNELTRIDFYKHWLPFSSLKLRLGEKLKLPGDEIESMLYYTENRQHFALSEQNIPCGNFTIPEAVSRIPDKMNFLNGEKDLAYVLSLYLHKYLCPFEKELVSRPDGDLNKVKLSSNAVLACFRINVIRYNGYSDFSANWYHYQ